MPLLEPLHPFVAEVVATIDSLPSERQELLTRVADDVVSRVQTGKPVHLTFICTHNSRRSHLAQIWCQVAAAYYEVPGVETYSGGTEATACNIRTVRSLRRAGLSVATMTPGKNPVYLVQYAESAPALKVFSKVYSEEGNPQSNYLAMMCCSDADQNCPIVRGASARFSLQYLDPKVSDGTPEEAARYDERSRQIAQEMFFLMANVAQRLK
ncbi:protein-tyrosine-phosphatase [bacterium]|nr:protein-tyrosine-phosphatase [bacterium]